ncbi:TolC family protein [Acidobacteriota bacterium]
MKKTHYLILTVILLIASLPGFTYSEDAISLTLEECISAALKNNLNIAIERYNPELADVSVTWAKEMFMPRLDLSYNRQSTESPSYWWLQGSDTQVSKSTDYSLTLAQKIPTGADISLSLENYKSNTNQSFQLINPRYGTTLRFNFSQPLLRGFGPKISRKEILIARNNLEISQNQFQTVLLDTVFRVQEAYWNLVYAVESFKVKQQSLQLGRDLLTKNRRMVELEKLAPIEILNAETVVAQREADILQAEALIRRSEDVLRNILNMDMNAEGMDLVQKIIPVDSPPEDLAREVSLKASLDFALNRRPELKATAKTVETKELNLSVAKNQMLPGLDLNLSYWSPGISGDRILYLDNNPFTGIIVGTEKGSGSDALGDALKFLYSNWSVGVTLTLPLSNIFTRAEFAQARIEFDKSQVELENTKRQILLEVRDAVREIETNAKRVDAYQVARELAERRLKAEEKKLTVGLTTNYFVLQFQEELANARTLELKALVDFNLSWAKLEKATGQSLRKHNILVE